MVAAVDEALRGCLVGVGVGVGVGAFVRPGAYWWRECWCFDGVGVDCGGQLLSLLFEGWCICRWSSCWVGRGSEVKCEMGGV